MHHPSHPTIIIYIQPRPPYHIYTFTCHLYHPTSVSHTILTSGRISYFALLNNTFRHFDSDRRERKQSETRANMTWNTNYNDHGHCTIFIN